MPYANQTPEQRKASNLKAYAKKLGLTVEQLKARREAARKWKQQNKHRRTKDGYEGSTRKKKGEPKWWQELQKKHAAFKGTRLEKSIKPPILLTLDENTGGEAPETR